MFHIYDNSNFFFKFSDFDRNFYYFLGEISILSRSLKYFVEDFIEDGNINILKTLYRNMTMAIKLSWGWVNPFTLFRGLLRGREIREIRREHAEGVVCNNS